MSDSGFRAVDSGFMVLDSGFFFSGTWIRDSSRLRDSSFQKEKFSESRLPFIGREKLFFALCQMNELHNLCINLVSRDISTPPSLPETGSCVPYNGSVCYNLLNGLSIYVRSLERLENIERKVSRAYAKISKISERCRPFVRRFLCHYEFPRCNSSLSVPKPSQICYEECEILRTSICPEEYLLSERLRPQQVLFPECPSLPRADTAEGKNCIKLNVTKTKTAKSPNSPNSPKSPKSPKPEKPTREKHKAGKGKGKCRS